MKILDRKTIYRDGEYVSFPNLAWIDENTLACFFRHAKERQKEWGKHTHIDPSAKDVFIVSHDNGRTFESVMHSVLDDDMSEQDPCVTVLSSGRIIITCFRWQIVPLGDGVKIWGKELYGRYGRTREGFWDSFNIGFNVNISDDKGKTWRNLPVILPEGYVPGSAVRGNIVELPGGFQSGVPQSGGLQSETCLLMPFYGAKYIGALASCGLMQSTDNGETWSFLCETACDREKNFLEPNLFRTKSEKLISMYRTQTDFLKPGVDFEDTYLNMHISVSSDGGKTFGPVKEIPSIFASSPFHALQLKSGKVFISYGYRKKPFGIRGKICSCELEDLESSPEIIFCDDAPNGDLGYPHSIQLKDGSILLSYYISGEDGIRKIEGIYFTE
ncbi:MAG: glycoside hydrolase [Treponema sp.]|nr:glycoside hydrolase [Treponema sp.]